MSIVDYCGNPTKDREQAQMRFESIFKPVLENIGFKQIGRSNNMWKEKTNQIVIVSSERFQHIPMVVKKHIFRN